MSTSSIYLRSAQLRMQSNALARRATLATIQLRPLADGAVLARTEARRLRAEASRLDELRRLSVVIQWRWPRTTLNDLNPDASRSFTDGEVFEDQELLARLNALGYQCDQCGAPEPLAAVVRFSDLSTALGICGDCYRELRGLALGQVM